MYDLSIIKEFLKTNIIGQTIIQYDNLNSTYEKAKSIFAACPDGTVVLSEYQSDCTFRFGNKWICSPDKNIYLSIILKSVNNNYLLPILDVVGCSSVQGSISKLHRIDCKIKWPNDIFINQNKISSVNSDIAGKGAGIILSVNINVNMDEKEENLKTTSIKIETNEEAQREELIGEILNNIEYQYDELIKSGKAECSVETYNDNLMFLGEEVGIIKRGRKTIKKVILKKIDSEGWLIVTNENGNEEILNPGDTIIHYENT